MLLLLGTTGVGREYRSQLFDDNSGIPRNSNGFGDDIHRRYYSQKFGRMYDCQTILMSGLLFYAERQSIGVYGTRRLFRICFVCLDLWLLLRRISILTKNVYL